MTLEHRIRTLESRIKAIAPKGPYLTMKEAAEYLSFSEGFLRRMVASGKIPHIIPAGTEKRGAIRFSVADLDEWMNDAKIQYA